MRVTAHVLGLCAWMSKAIRKAIIAVLRHGPVPQHIAFIMDGNRRFATKQGLKRIHGHQQGYLKVSWSAISNAISMENPHIEQEPMNTVAALGRSAMEPGLGCEGHHRICVQHRQLPPRHRRGGCTDGTCRAETARAYGGACCCSR